MGTICILLGLIILIAFTGVGFLLTNTVISGEIMGQSMLSFLGMQSATTAYIVIVGACAFIGLLICLAMVMNGLIYNRVCKNGAALKKISRH